MAKATPPDSGKSDQRFPLRAVLPPPDPKASRRARRAELRTSAPDPLLTAEESAAETGRAVSTFWRDVRRGILPAAYYVTPRAPRWRRSELRAAVEAAPRAPAAR